MTCPDATRLDLWLDDALPSAEASVLTAHVDGCATCAARQRARRAEDATWQAALALDAAELAHLARADLSARWRASTAAPVAGSARWWPALLLLALAGTYLGWWLASAEIVPIVDLANRLGLVGLVLAWVLAQVWQAAAGAAEAVAQVPASDMTVLLASLAVVLWLGVAKVWASPGLETT